MGLGSDVVGVGIDPESRAIEDANKDHRDDNSRDGNDKTY